MPEVDPVVLAKGFARGEEMIDSFNWLGPSPTHLTEHLDYVYSTKTQTYVLMNPNTHNVFMQLVMWTPLDVHIDGAEYSNNAWLRHSNGQQVMHEGVPTYEWSYIGFLPGRTNTYSWVRLFNSLNVPAFVSWELRTSFDESSPPTTPPTPTYYPGEALVKPWKGGSSEGIKRDDDADDVYQPPPATQPSVEQLYSLVSNKPIDAPSLVLRSPSLGGITSLSMQESIFIANWDTGRGPTTASTGEAWGYTTGKVMEYQDAITMCINSADMSFFNFAVDDMTNKPTYGRTYVSKIDSWVSYPGKPDFGRPGANIHVTSRYFQRQSGYHSGVAVASGGSFGSREATVEGKLLSSAFSDKRNIGAGLVFSQVRSQVGDLVTSVTGWPAAPYTYEVSSGILSFHVGF